jgi:BolA protein
MGAIADIIRTKLGAALKPSRLEIIDDSARHAGHAGIQRQRLVYEVLADELAGPIHALSLRAIGPGED